MKIAHVYLYIYKYTKTSAYSHHQGSGFELENIRKIRLFDQRSRSTLENVTYRGPEAPHAMTEPGKTEPQHLREKKDPDGGNLLFPTQPPPFWLSDKKGREIKRENQEERERGLGEREKSSDENEGKISECLWSQ